MTTDSFWGDDFSAFEITSTHEIFAQQAALLPKLTKDFVSAELVQIKAESLIQDEFIYRFYLVGKYLNNYRFTVCTFSHGINIYPVKIRVDEHVSDEIGISSSYETLNSADECRVLIKQILSSSRIRSVISGIIKLSDSSDLPPF